MRVAARASEKPIRVERGDNPEIDSGRRGALEPTRDRDACLFVSVDAADHELALATIRVANLVGNNRSPFNGPPQKDAAPMPRGRAPGAEKSRDRYEPSQANQYVPPHRFDRTTSG